MDPAQLLHLGEELVYDLFGVVFLAFFAVTVVAFRKPLLAYCTASFVVSSALWAMTTVFNIGYMFPHLVRSICRLERQLRVSAVPGALGDEQQQGVVAAAFMSMSGSMLNLHRNGLEPAVISPPIDSAIATNTNEMGSASPREHLASGLSSTGVSGCLAVMFLVCACSALLVAVSVGMVLEANIIEQERERQMAVMNKESREYDHHDALEAAAATPLIPRGQRQRQQPAPVCCCRGQGPCSRGGRQPPSVVMRAAVWINYYVGIDELRYTDVYTTEECDALPRITGSFFFLVPRVCTRLFLGPARMPSARSGRGEEGGETAAAMP
ncbi:hypothetical protein MN608_08448 [Microdochium nivale]|nr:hypothetical protein MN608_08448 [Microdochium nivale]